MRACALFVSLSMLLGTVPLLAQGAAPATVPITQESFHTEVMATFGFHPRDLKTQEEREPKLQALETFWKKIEADKAVYLPLLQTELDREDMPAYFYLDGANLLLSISETGEDQARVLRAYTRVDLKGLDGTLYLMSVHFCAGMGADTTAAALHTLSDPGFDAFIDQHALEVKGGLALIFMLYPREEKEFLPAVLSTLKDETDEEATKSLLTVLEVAAVPEAKTAIRVVAEDPDRPEGVRKYARESLDIIAEQQRSKAPRGSEEKLRKERREAIQRLSDEGLDDFMALTKQLWAKQR